MASGLQSLVNQLIANPRQLFLIDGLGALLTAFFLAVILAKFEAHFGMPRNVLYPLAIVACIFAIYSMSCYFFLPVHWRPYLKVIALANLTYCCLTLALVIFHYQSLMVLGLLYFLLELVVVGALIYIELRVAAK